MKVDDISVCMFDAYGTLFDVAAAVRRCQNAIGSKAESLAQLWRQKQLEYTWLRSLMGRFVDFWHVTGEALDTAMNNLGISDAPLRARLMELYLTLDAYADARPTLEKLKGLGLRTGILSNGSRSMLVAASGHAKLDGVLDAVLSVDRIGIFKPHPTVYEMVTQHFDIEAQRVGFVSGNYWDAAAAATFGFRSVWINRLGARREPLPGKLSGEIKSLSELPALLGA